MTELYSSVGQNEVEAALGRVVSLAGYSDLPRDRASWCESGVKPTRTEREPQAAAREVTILN